MTISSLSSSSMQRPDAAAMREKMFTTADTDGSGTITQSELETAMANMPTPPDAPDGATAPDATEMFSQMDADSDGAITEDEMKAFDEAREAEMQAKFEAGQPNEFSGSTDFLQSILDQLNGTSSTSTDSSSSDSSDSSSDSSATSTSEATRQQLVQELLKRLQEQSPVYSADGSASGSSGSLFSKTV